MSGSWIGANAMRCEDVVRELSAPGGRRISSGVSEHLARCPRCASWADQAARFDQVWRQTRPAEPSGTTFDEIWARVVNAAGSSRRGTAPVRPAAGGVAALRPRYWLAPLAAAAAAIALAFGPGLARRGINPPAPDSQAVLASFEAEPGETLVIEISGRTATSKSLPPSEISETVTVAADIDVFNFMESQGSL
jgi:hypothetical protein